MKYAILASILLVSAFQRDVRASDQVLFSENVIGQSSMNLDPARLCGSAVCERDRGLQTFLAMNDYQIKRLAAEESCNQRLGRFTEHHEGLQRFCRTLQTPGTAYGVTLICYHSVPVTCSKTVEDTRPEFAPFPVRKTIKEVSYDLGAGPRTISAPNREKAEAWDSVAECECISAKQGAWSRVVIEQSEQAMTVEYHCAR